MLRGFKILAAISLIPSWILANENVNQNVNRFECASCHGGGNGPNLPAAQAVSLIDMDTMGAVSQYEAGKTYKIQIRFNNPNAGPWTNAYVLHIAETSTGAALRAGSIVDSGLIGLVTDGGPTVPQSNARIISSAVKASVDNAELQWQAPNSGTVRFQVLRMETNNSNNTGGDRVSQNLETFTFSAMGEPPPDEDPEITDTTGDGTGDNGNSDGGPGFSSDLQAGCGVLQANSPKGSIFGFFMMLFTLVFLRHLNQSRYHRSS